jgi:hypothetical protein
MCFVNKEDIPLKVVDCLLLVLFSICYPLVLIFARDLLLYKRSLVDPTAICMLP